MVASAGRMSNVGIQGGTRDGFEASSVRDILRYEQLEDRRILVTFTPVNVADLVAAISMANVNAEDDEIDLGGQTFVLNERRRQRDERP